MSAPLPIAIFEYAQLPIEPPRPTVTLLNRASPHTTSSLWVGVEVPIPTLAPLPRTIVFDWSSTTFAPIAVEFDISESV